MFELIKFQYHIYNFATNKIGLFQELYILKLIVQ